ncbi:MAG: hypothetical protein QGF61_02695 [Pelagibacteraceae bacterium]|jgi:hypothetical protein|nr:hypothetical protein [Pelagibacteraceae bacterium]
MVLKGFDQVINSDFSWNTSDLKKHVFIYARKQIRQEKEGIGAC